MVYLLSIFFFFQAEDGIRDVAVTGVQTCALPISQIPAAYCRPLPPHCRPIFPAMLSVTFLGTSAARPTVERNVYAMTLEIGRASCRERVEIWEGDGALSKKIDHERNDTSRSI